MEEKIVIVIYANEAYDVFTDDFLEHINIGMFDVEISKDILFEFFKDKCLEDFRNEHDDKVGLSDKAYFEDWLLEYTADDTIGLWSYARKYNKEILICGTWKG